jgi:tRNA/tmRNA/rRNA uracil-C5-methylase (TrmA/RlmC/RlmD family)
MEEPQESSPPSLEPGTEVTVRFHGVAHGGECVGSLPDGRVVFVGGVIPGELAAVRITRRKKRWARADLVEVIEASPDRVQAPCPYFGPCGGCQWQHIALPRQRAMKREVLVGQLEHLGGIADPPVEEVRTAGPDDGFGYRNHATFAMTEDGRTAYHQSRSSDLVAVESCLLLHPLLREWHEALPPLDGAFGLELRAGTRTAQRLALVRGQISEASYEAAQKRGVPLKRAGHDEITEMVGIDKFRVSSKSFFQVNTDGAEILVELVTSMLEPGPESQVLDLYAGVGLFTIPLARAAAKVFAVESNPAAIRDLRFHAKGQPIHIVGTRLEDADEQLPQRVDLAVADPPREGLGAAAAMLAARKPERIVLVACDPASLARDAKSLVEAGYALARVVPVDLFPQTYHIEAVALFTRA